MATLAKRFRKRRQGHSGGASWFSVVSRPCPVRKVSAHTWPLWRGDQLGRQCINIHPVVESGFLRAWPRQTEADTHDWGHISHCSDMYHQGPGHCMACSLRWEPQERWGLWGPGKPGSLHLLSSFSSAAFWIRRASRGVHNSRKRDGWTVKAASSLGEATKFPLPTNFTPSHLPKSLLTCTHYCDKVTH